jgi:excisionase family DNA binding protein
MRERVTITVPEFARIMGISERLAYDMVNRGDVRHVRMGRRILIPRTVPDEILAASEPSPTREPAAPLQLGRPAVSSPVTAARIGG